MLVQIYFKESAAMLEIVRVESVTALKDTVALSVNVTIWPALVTTEAYVAVSITPQSISVRLIKIILPGELKPNHVWYAIQ